MGKRTLTPEQEVEIFAKVQAEEDAGRKPNFQAIATEYDVDRSTISRAVARQRKASDGNRPAAGSGVRPDDSPSHSASQIKGDGMDGKDRSATGVAEVDMNATGLKRNGEAVLASAVVDLPWNLIHPSPLNPRKHFDPDAVAELAENIHQVGGVKQNVLVRPRADMPGHYWLIAGERRHRAVGILVETARVAAEFPMPARIEVDCDDRKHLKLAMVENLQRQDMNPMEEAEGYARLAEQGMSAGDIAREIIGKPEKQRYVQLRIGLVTKLCDKAQDALREGRITVEQARALTDAPVELQPKHLPNILTRSWGYDTTDGIRRQIRSGHVEVKHFPHLRDRYTGPFTVDEDTGEEYYADPVALREVQDQELEEWRAKLADEWPWVEIKGGSGRGGYFSSTEYKEDRTSKLAGAVIEILHNGKLNIHRGLVRRADLVKLTSAPNAKVDEKSGKVVADSEPFTQGHFAHAKRRKSTAMRYAVTNDSTAAKRLVCLALLGGTSCVDITEADRRRTPENHGDALALTEKVKSFGRAWGIRKGDGFRISADGKVRAGDYRTVESDELQIWSGLMAMSEQELDDLFCALVALRVGTFTEYTPTMGDNPVAIAIANSLGLVGHEEKHSLGLDREDLEGLRKNGMLAAVRLAGAGSHLNDGRGIDAMPAKDLKEGLAKLVPALGSKFVLPTLRFASEAAIKTALNSSVHPVMAQIDLVDAIEKAKAAAPEPSLQSITFEDVRAVIAMYSTFPVEPESALIEMVEEGEMDAFATELVETFGIPTLTRAHLRGVEEITDLVTLLSTLQAAAKAA